MNVISSKSAQLIETPDGWWRWDVTNLAAIEVGAGPAQQRAVRPDVAWLIEPDEGFDVQFGMLHVDHVHGPRPRALELRARLGRDDADAPGRAVDERPRRRSVRLPGTGGLRTLACDPGIGLDARDSYELFRGGLLIVLVADPSVAVSFFVLFRHYRSAK